MPLRVLLTMVGLVAACLAAVGAAWALNSEIYLFIIAPDFSFEVPRPPTPPWLMLAAIGLGLGIGAWSRHYGLALLTFVTGLVCLGTGVGFVAFGWIPGLAQYALMAAMLATVLYGWRNEEYLDY